MAYILMLVSESSYVTFWLGHATILICDKKTNVIKVFCNIIYKLGSKR